MKKSKLLKDVLMVFWFGWFALGGVLTTALVVWLLSAEVSADFVLYTGAMIGILTGGIITLTLFILALRKYGPDFMRDQIFLKN